MCERTTDIRPLTPEGIEFMELITANSKPVYYKDQLFFNKFGGLILQVNQTFPSINYQIWTPKLLEYSPEETILSIYRGQLVISNSQRIVLKSISPEALRVLAFESEMGVVQESGYILSESVGRCYPFGSNLRLSTQEFDKILQQANAGHQPTHFDNSTRVRVDPSLVGEKLWVGIFDFDLGTDIWNKDAVVIDPKTRKMVAREVLQPLSRARWEQTPALQNITYF